ncbi:ankyrin repeat-containing domain protein, partial [Immersiella caudata]
MSIPTTEEQPLRGDEGAQRGSQAPAGCRGQSFHRRCDWHSAEEKTWEHILTNRGRTKDLAELRLLFPNYDIDAWGFSSLHKAVLALQGSLDRILLQVKDPNVPNNNNNINVGDARGRTPLHWAALRSDLPTLTALLEAGASVHTLDLSSASPLLYAVSSAVPRIVELLLLRGANPNTPNTRGDTPLHHAARHKDDLRIVKLLVEAGAVVDARNALGNTPLSGAAITNRVAAGAYLVEQGADQHSANMYGDTPLREAVQHNCVEFLRMLLDKGTRYDEVNRRGETVWHALALEGRTETVRVFLKVGVKGVDPQSRNKDGKTAGEVLAGRMGVSVGFREAFGELLGSLGGEA